MFLSKIINKLFPKEKKVVNDNYKKIKEEEIDAYKSKLDEKEVTIRELKAKLSNYSIIIEKNFPTELEDIFIIVKKNLNVKQKILYYQIKNIAQEFINFTQKKNIRREQEQALVFFMGITIYKFLHTIDEHVASEILKKLEDFINNKTNYFNCKRVIPNTTFSSDYHESYYNKIKEGEPIKVLSYIIIDKKTNDIIQRALVKRKV